MVTAPHEPVALTRACTATAIPQGAQGELPEGTVVRIVQRLGDSITVRAERGGLWRIDGNDADALGLDCERPVLVRDQSVPFALEHVVDALQTVYDPEIPVSIVELGLVYRCEQSVAADGTRTIMIDMSMTAPGCGMGDVLRADAARVVHAVPGVDAVEVTLVWTPPWTIDRMSEAARLELGML